MQKNHHVCSEYVEGPFLMGNRHHTPSAHGTRFDTANVDITSSRSGHHEGGDGMRCHTIHKKSLLIISINGSSIQSVDGSTSVADVPSKFPSMSIETQGRRPYPERSRSHRKGALDGRNSELDVSVMITLTPFSSVSCAQPCRCWASIAHPSDTVLFTSPSFRTGSHAWAPRSERHWWACHP